MALVQLKDICLSFGEREILKNVNLSLAPGKKIALTGANGSGKSTLMMIIAQKQSADSGHIIIQNGTRVSYLPQSVETLPGRELKKEVEKAFDHWKRLWLRVKELEELLHTTDEKSEQLPALLQEHQILHDQLVAGDYYQKDALIERVLLGLGFDKKDFSRSTSEFSGGWQMRIALAKVLLEQPDILLLDEPTNYLDLEARNWLEDFLREYKGGILIVSHDRYFLDVTVSEIAELFTGSLKRYKGNYSTYEQKREGELAALQIRYKKQQEEIARAEEFIRRFRSNSSKAKLVQSRIKQLEKMERVEIPEGLKKMHFSFPPPPHVGKDVLVVENLSKQYGPKQVFKNLNLHLSQGEKLVVLGINGAGKSTLLRILAGEDPDFQGSVRYGKDLISGFFSQNHEQKLNGTNTIIQELEQEAPLQLIPQLRNLLGTFLFRGDDIYKPVSVLSGGEKNRLSLLKLLLHPANLLILDEPTNHLDLNSKDILLEALSAYSGTLVFVSHDRYFIDNLATKVLEIKQEDTTLYPGNYSYFLWKKEQEGGPPRELEQLLPLKNPSQGKQNREKEKLLKTQIKRLQKEEQQLLEKTETLETERKELEESLGQAENYTDAQKTKTIKERLEAVSRELEQITSRWEEVEQALSQLVLSG